MGTGLLFEHKTYLVLFEMTCSLFFFNSSVILVLVHKQELLGVLIR